LLYYALRDNSADYLANIHTLDLSANYLDMSDLLIAVVKQCHKLNTLNLSNNQITDVEELMPNVPRSLEYLNLRNNNIELLEPENYEPMKCNLIQLDISFNKLSNPSIEYLITVLPVSIKYLFLGNNHIHDRNFTKEFEKFQNLIVVDVRHNGITQKTIKRLLKCKPAVIDASCNLITKRIEQSSTYVILRGNKIE